jgi:hypothetical protein
MLRKCYKKALNALEIGKNSLFPVKFNWVCDQANPRACTTAASFEPLPHHLLTFVEEERNDWDREL